MIKCSLFFLIFFFGFSQFTNAEIDKGLSQECVVLFLETFRNEFNNAYSVDTKRQWQSVAFTNINLQIRFFGLDKIDRRFLREGRAKSNSIEDIINRFSFFKQDKELTFDFKLGDFLQFDNEGSIYLLKIKLHTQWKIDSQWIDGVYLFKLALDQEILKVKQVLRFH